MGNTHKASIRPFSLRHAKALVDGRLSVAIPENLRNRLWSTAKALDEVYYYSPEGDPGLHLDSSALQDADPEYGRLLGIEEYRLDGYRQPIDIHDVVMQGRDANVLDVMEIYYAVHSGDRSHVQRSINDAFVDFACPWRLADGMFFKMDSTFLEEEVLAKAASLLGAPELEGAHDEFQRARDHLTDGSARDAIAYAAHSVESTLIAVTGKVGTLEQLIHAFLSYGMDDLPSDCARATGKALQGAGILRNSLGGHGQGAAVLNVPRPYAELAVHLAATLNHFIVTQHLRKSPPPKPEPVMAQETRYFRDNDLDDIPF